ncbi:MAG: EAL domain-containing protein [Bryobacterales bacterium]|nr:EAL domain-containing protein [Bryobacterales bacterium]
MRLFSRHQIGFSTLLLTRFLALVVVSVMAVAYFGVRKLGMSLRQDAEVHLRDAALRVCEGVDSYLALHQKAVLALSYSLHTAPAGGGRALLDMHRAYPGFLTMLITDASGRIIHISDRGKEQQAVEKAGSVADRAYFQQPLATGKPYVSGVFEGRGLGTDPIVAVSAPITDAGGKFLGIVEGSIDITRLPLTANEGHTSPLVVAQDSEGRVVYSTRHDLHRPLEQWEPYPLGESATDSAFLLADPAQLEPSGDPTPLYSVRFPLNIAGWQVVAAMPAQEIHAEAEQFFREAASLLILVLLVAWELTRLLAGRIASPIVALAGAMKDYQLDGSGAAPVAGDHPAKEISEIEAEFHRLGARLRDSYQQLRAALADRDRTNGQLQEILGELDRKVADRTAQLADSEARYRQVIESSGDIIFRTDLCGNITFHNASFALFITGNTGDDCTGRSVFRLIGSRCRRAVLTAARKQFSEQTPSIYLEYTVTGRGGEIRWIGQSTQLLFNDEQEACGFQGIARDITEKKTAELALREAEERFALAVRGSNNGIWDWDLRTGDVYFAPRWKQMFGIPEGTELRSPEDWFGRIHPEDAAGIRSTIRGYIQMGQDHFEAEHRMRHSDGTWRWVLVSGAAVRGADGRALRIAGSKTDITAGKLADPLTGLPNRLSLLDVIDAWNARLREDPSRQFSLLFLDLDRFKLINDSLGHMRGDHLLLGVAHRLSAALQSVYNTDGIVARVGGDEFVILVETANATEAHTQLAAKIIAAMEPAFHLDGSLVFVSTSIGIANSGVSPSSAENLLRDADTAMYHAKGAGRGRFAVFDSSMHARAVARLGMETDLRRAIDDNEFVLHYQPQVDLTSGTIAGFEALVRWQHPVRGFLPPGEFIPVAEENGVILPLGRWVLKEGCRQMAEWDKLHPEWAHLSMSINLSARQFTDPTLASEVARILSETGLKPQRLHLEVTESMLADDPVVAQEILKQLSTMGVALEVDDFGTGYSCLGQLNQLPFDTLKIDRSFVRALDLERDGHKMLDSIASLAGSLDINVVAEGVETLNHWKYLARLGCQYGQGYYFSRPLDAKAALELAEFRQTTPWTIPSSEIETLAALAEATAEPGAAESSRVR